MQWNARQFSLFYQRFRMVCIERGFLRTITTQTQTTHTHTHTHILSAKTQFPSNRFKVLWMDTVFDFPSISSKKEILQPDWIDYKTNFWGAHNIGTLRLRFIRGAVAMCSDFLSHSHARRLLPISTKQRWWWEVDTKKYQNTRIPDNWSVTGNDAKGECDSFIH